MVTPRYSARGAPILLPDGTVLVAGGIGLLDNALSTRPSSTTRPPGSWVLDREHARVLQGRGHGAPCCPNGMVLVSWRDAPPVCLLRPPSCTTQRLGHGPSPLDGWQGGSPDSFRPRSCRMAPCWRCPAVASRSAPRCTTRVSGPGRTTGTMLGPTQQCPGHAAARRDRPHGGWRDGHSGAVRPGRRVAAMTVASHPDPDSDLDQTTRRR